MQCSVKSRCTVDIICPLYNAEGYLKSLHNSILNQKNVNINNIRYILTKGTDSTEEILKNLSNCIFKVIAKTE